MTTSEAGIRRPGRFFAFALALALGAAGLERTVLWIRASLAEPGTRAAWIWASDLSRESDPVAFYAVRDFEIEELAGSKNTAELLVTADESYTAFVNGRRVGSGAYRDRGPVDLYDVTEDLEPGWNRLAVELVSRRGAGGLWASVLLDGRPIVVTDSDWRILRRFEPALVRGLRLSEGEAPQVWQRHPTGRWRLAANPRVRSGEPESLDPPPIARARRMRGLWETSLWRDFESSDRDLPRDLIPWNVFDWGEEITGHLALAVGSEPGETQEVGLLHFGLEIPDPESPADAFAVPVPGRGLWVDASARRFRYVFIASVELEAVPWVRQVDPEQVQPRADLRGVFGIGTAARRLPVEKEIRRRLSKGRRP